MTATVKDRKRARDRGRDRLRYPCGSLVLPGDTYTRDSPDNLLSLTVTMVTDGGVSAACGPEYSPFWISRDEWVSTNMCRVLTRTTDAPVVAGKRILISRSAGGA